MQQRLRLLHITSSLKMGGAETLLCDLIEQLNDMDHQVLYMHDGPYVSQLRDRGIPVQQIKGLFFRYDPIFFIRLVWAVKKSRPDCIHTLLWAANVFGRVVGWMLRIPVVSVLHNNVDTDGLVRCVLDRLSMKCATRVVAVSDGVVASLQQRDGFVPAQKLQVIPNGIDAHKIRVVCEQHKVDRSALQLLPDDFVIGSVGRFVPEKNYELLVASFALVQQQLPQARLVLVGVGPLEHALRAQVDQLGIAQYVRWVIGKRAYGYYPVFDCFSLSSDREGISMALLEAMSCGVPGVVTHQETVHAVITNGIDGLLVRAGDAQALSSALLRVGNDESLRRLMARQAQATVEGQFGSLSMCNAYRKVFMSSLAEKSC